MPKAKKIDISPLLQVWNERKTSGVPASSGVSDSWTDPNADPLLSEWQKKFPGMQSGRIEDATAPAVANYALADPIGDVLEKYSNSGQVVDDVENADAFSRSRLLKLLGKTAEQFGESGPGKSILESFLESRINARNILYHSTGLDRAPRILESGTIGKPVSPLAPEWQKPYFSYARVPKDPFKAGFTVPREVTFVADASHPVLKNAEPFMFEGYNKTPIANDKLKASDLYSISTTEWLKGAGNPDQWKAYDKAITPQVEEINKLSKETIEGLYKKYQDFTGVTSPYNYKKSDSLEISWHTLQYLKDQFEDLSKKPTVLLADIQQEVKKAPFYIYPEEHYDAVTKKANQVIKSFNDSLPKTAGTKFEFESRTKKPLPLNEAVKEILLNKKLLGTYGDRQGVDDEIVQNLLDKVLNRAAKRNIPVRELTPEEIVTHRLKLDK